MIIENSKCENCLNFIEQRPRKCATYEYGISCKEHYFRFWDVVTGELKSCPLYDPYQLELPL